MSVRRKVCGLAAATALLLSCATVFTSQNAGASSWLVTTDIDFLTGDFFIGSGFEIELHGTGIDAYLQNKKDSYSWFEMLPQTDPGPRKSFGFTNDSFSGRMILFGGLDGSFARNDTWTYDYSTGDWERICADDTAECAPPRRAFASMAYDNNSRVAVLFGGYAADLMTLLTDTWEFNVESNTWVNWSSPVCPRGLTAHSMVYDAKDERVILVGRDATSMEVWEYDAVNHTWTERSPGSGPSLRSGFALGYSYQAGHERIVLFGGSELMNVYNDTWEYDYVANTWSEVSPATSPSGRTGAAMIYSPEYLLQGIILWGGIPASAETWRYSWMAGSPVWEQILVPSSPTPARKDHGMAYEPGHNEILMFGGTDQSGNALNDSWHLAPGFRLEGKYASGIFNALYTDTIWRYIFWNQTPADVPPNTLIRFQLNATNDCDITNPAVWRGPDGTSNTYYTLPGTALWPGLSGNRCLRFLADMITTDPSVAPRLEDVSVCYNTTCTAALRLISYYPVGPAVLAGSPIYLNFSKVVNTSNVHVSMMPNITFDVPWNWYGSDTMVKITHGGDPFREATRYDICVWASDLSGQPMVDGKKCWFFSVYRPMPFITGTIPQANSVDVSLIADIQITFSTRMNTSTCWPYVTIDPPITFDGHTWSAGDSVLTLTHSLPFAQFTTYTVDVPIGNVSRPCRDEYGLLLTIGPTAVPWSFTTVSINPHIIVTEPMDLETEVSINAPIKVTFSTDMNALAFYYRVEEWDSVARSWKNSTLMFSLAWTGRTIFLNHAAAFSYCRPYRVTIWALDTDNKSLIPHPYVPNPWKFMTVGASGACAPFMIFTMPSNGEEGVSVDEIVTIVWYYSPPDTGGMDPSSFTFSVKDQLGNELNVNNQFSTKWIGMGPSAVELQHPGFPFSRCTKYTVEVLTAEDIQGRAFIAGPAENPFQFRTDMSDCPPSILWMDPDDGEEDVGLEDPIIIDFSEPLDTASTIFTLVPDASPYSMFWTEGDTNLSIQHRPFEPCTWYLLTITAYDEMGLWNVFRINFKTVCSLVYITETLPNDGEIDTPLTAPIYINFSVPMDPASLVFEIVPYVGTLTYVWTNDNKTVIIYHVNPFASCTIYTARVVSARSEGGGSLQPGPVPNPWIFTTYCCGLWLYYTIPADGEMDVGPYDPIIAHFSCQIDRATFGYSIVPFIRFERTTWLDDETVKLEHAQPFAASTTYTMEVWAKDVYGDGLIPGFAPNPWNFTVQDYTRVRGLRVERIGSDVRLVWDPDPGAQSYRVFHSNDKMAPWPWPLITSVTTNYYVHSNGIADNLDHFYIVRSVVGGNESMNSTMGALWHMQVTPNVGKTSAHWLSLPFNSIYNKASDIAGELGPDNINLIAKWDSASQKLIVYYYMRGFWRGPDFPIESGEALMIGIVAAFDWAVNGTDRAFPLTFTYRSPPSYNYYWISLPFTGGIVTARDLVLSIEGGFGPGSNTKIDAIGKWNYTRQAYDFFRYTPTGWGGVDFKLKTGDCVWIEITSTFTWIAPLLTPEVP